MLQNTTKSDKGDFIMNQDNCIFCKLANGIIPTNSIYEDEDFNVILDIAPTTKGHAIILPKKHYKNIYEIPEELAAKAMALAKKMAAHMTEKLNCDGFNLLQNNNEVAGQTVFHFHIHLIPRYKDDAQKIDFNVNKISDEELQELKTLLHKS